MKKTKIIIVVSTAASVVGALFLVHGVVNASVVGGLVGLPLFVVGLAIAGTLRVWLWIKS